MAGKKMAHGRISRELLKIKEQIAELSKADRETAAAPESLVKSDIDTQMKERIVELGLANNELLQEINRLRGVEDEIGKQLRVTENLMQQRVEQLEKVCEDKALAYCELQDSYNAMEKAYAKINEAYNELETRCIESEKLIIELQQSNSGLASTIAELEKQCLEMQTAKEGLEKEIAGLMQRSPSYQESQMIESISRIKECQDGVIKVNTDGIITAWGQEAEVLCGYSAAEVTGFPISILIPRNSYDDFRASLGSALVKTGAASLKTIFVRKDGEQTSVEIKISPIVSENGEVTGAAIST